MADVFPNRFRRDPMLTIVGFLKVPTAACLVDRPSHRFGHFIGVKNDFRVDVSSRPANGLDEGCLAPQEAFFIGIQNGHHRDFGQIQAFAQ